MSYFTKSQRGFTLIEMSIVLIIIGLIIGGILKGQELIESSRQKNFVSQIDQIRSGINTFLDNYKALPGDYNQAVARIHASLANGDNDGSIGTMVTDAAALYGVDGTVGENYQFFNHLTAANLVGGTSVVTIATFTAGTPAFAGNGTLSPLPGSAYPRSGLMATYGVHEGAATDGSRKRSVWLRASTFGTTLAATNAIISPQRAYQLDSKYDDTLPYAGRIRTTYTAASPAAADDCGNTTGTGVGYTATVSSTACILLLDAIN